MTYFIGTIFLHVTVYLSVCTQPIWQNSSRNTQIHTYNNHAHTYTL